MSQELRIEGGLLPASLLDRLLAADPRLEGTAPGTWHCESPAELSGAMSRAWVALVPRWRSFKAALDALPDAADATPLTRQRWLLPLLQELGYGRLLDAAPLVQDGRAWLISHGWMGVPVHLVGAHQDLDRRSLGAASPHGMVQDLLNRSDAHRWAIVSNGLELRLLRDHAALTRQAFLSFDLEAIFEGESFSGFRLLWLLAHQSRLEALDEPQDCWLERWFKRSRDEGVEAVTRLRGCVRAAIEHLGGGFLRHEGNTALRDALRAGTLSWGELYAELRRLIYRLLFVFVAEERGLLLDPAAPEVARRRYQQMYHTGRLRRRARFRQGGPHEDGWLGLRVVLDGLDQGCPALALPGLGSALFRGDSLPFLSQAHLGNEALYDALRSLGEVELNRRLWPIDWATVEADELGSVYEGLLEYEPEGDLALGTFRLNLAPGNARKRTGSYYTPSELVDALLDEALEPVLDRAEASPDPQAALLALRIVDPACGSGHFLVAVGRRLALRLARVRAGGVEPSRAEVLHALREVVGRCLYGVDLEPTAVELCKVALWLEALEPGRSLAFLDGHIRAGNALLGATPEAMARGIPDEAWDPLAGDDKEIAKRLKRRNKDWRQGQLFEPVAAPVETGLAGARRAVDAIDDRDPAGQRERERAFREVEQGTPLRLGRLLADLWCSAFVWPKQDAQDEASAPVRGSWEIWRRHPDRIPDETRRRAEQAARSFEFFHWHLAFADVFESGGFDVVLGNPPWERIKLQEEEFFATLSPEVANAANAAARKRKIAALQADNPGLWRRWREALRVSEGESALLRRSTVYPLCGRGDINTYAVFAERMRAVLSPSGRAGAVLPFGIATDATTSAFFMDMVETRTLGGLFGFENEGKLFVDVDHRVNFCLLVVAGSAQEGGAEFSAFLRHAAQIRDPDRRFRLTAEDIALINPNTKTCPVFRTRRDAEITKGVYRRVPVLWREDPLENPWGLSFQAMLHMANDSGLFRTRHELESDGWTLRGNVFVRGESRYLPLYEAKMMQLYDHRYGDFGRVAPGERGHILPPVPPEDHENPAFSPLPRYWVDEREVDRALLDDGHYTALVAWRKVTDSRSSARTMIASVLPRTATGDSLHLLKTTQSAIKSAALAANLMSFVLDYVVRQKLGGVNLQFYLAKQIPLLGPATCETSTPWSPRQTLADWIRPRVLELVYTAHDLAPFAADLGYTGPPFRWDPRRRHQLRCELDAAFFLLYGVSREDTAYILDTFPIVRDREVKEHGEYLSRRLILDLYDSLAAAGPRQPWTSPLSPPPGDPEAAHPAPAAIPTEDAEVIPLFPEHPMIPCITRVVVEGYRSIRALDAVLEPFSVVVGPNGSGKSNIVNALALLGDVLGRGSLEPLDERGFGGLLYQHDGRQSRELVLGAELRLRPPEEGNPDPPWLRVSVRLEIEGQGPELEPILRAEQITIRPEAQRGVELELRIERDKPRVRLSGGAEGLVTAFAPGLSAEGSARDLAARLTQHIDPGALAGRRNRSILRLLNLSRHYSPLLQDLVDRVAVRTLRPESGALKDLAEGAAGLTRSGKGLAGLVRRLRGGGREPTAEFEADVLAVLRQIFPEVSDVSTAAIMSNLLALKVQDADVGGWLTPDQVSDGFLHLLGVLAATADRQPGALVLEEPENAIHPWALRTLLDHLQDQEGRQIIITTHSPVVVDRLRQPASLLLAERDTERGTTLISAPEREEALASILSESGMKLGEVWTAGMLGAVVRGGGA